MVGQLAELSMPLRRGGRLPSPSEPSSEAHLYVSLARNRAVEVSDGESLARAEGGRRHVARAPRAGGLPGAERGLNLLTSHFRTQRVCAVRFSKENGPCGPCRSLVSGR